MTTWWWVRHGPTHARTFVGWRDLPADLSDSAALARLNAFLPARAALVSSDLLRARATADVLAAPGRRRLPDTPELREFEFGAWDGLDFDTVGARDPETSRAFWEQPGDIAPPRGESWNQVAARVARYIDAMNGRHSDIVAVAHIGVILTAIQRATGSSPAEALDHRIDNLSVTRLSHGPDGWHTGSINHVA